MFVAFRGLFSRLELGRLNDVNPPHLRLYVHRPSSHRSKPTQFSQNPVGRGGERARERARGRISCLLPGVFRRFLKTGCSFGACEVSFGCADRWCELSSFAAEGMSVSHPWVCRCFPRLNSLSQVSGNRRPNAHMARDYLPRLLCRNSQSLFPLFVRL